MNQDREDDLLDEGPPAPDRWPERWIDRPGEDDPESHAGALFRVASRREPLEAGRLTAIGERLRSRGRRPRARRAWRVAMALGRMLSGSALTATANWYFHRASPGGFGATAPPAATPPARLKVHLRSRPAVAPPLPAPVGETVARMDDPLPPRSRPAQIRQTPSPPQPPIAPPGATSPPPLDRTQRSASALAEESGLLSEALRRLRNNDDAEGALALLDQHDARFANAALAPEASLARIEALMKVRRNSDALSLLDGMTPSPIGIGRDLLIARAELRAAAGRCAMAAPDFDLLLRGASDSDSVTERALWGRASCRARGTDATGARGDLESYLSRFPAGRFARGARAALGE
jgi:hypothetical protein